LLFEFAPPRQTTLGLLADQQHFEKRVLDLKLLYNQLPLKTFFFEALLNHFLECIEFAVEKWL
jgi:hypothetical protein